MEETTYEIECRWLQADGNWGNWKSADNVRYVGGYDAWKQVERDFRRTKHITHGRVDHRIVRTQRNIVPIN